VRWWLVRDANLETRWTPVNESDGAASLQLGNGSVDVLGDDITTIEQRTGHVLSLHWIAIDHLATALEAGGCDGGNIVRFVQNSVHMNDWRERGKRKVNSWEGDKIRLEFIQIDVQGTGKAKRNGDRGDHLGDQSVQIGEAWLGNPELLLADPEDRFVVNHKGTIGMFQGCVSCQHRVVRFNDRVGQLRCRIHAELQFRLLPIVGRKVFQQEGTKTRASTATEGVENKESLEASAVIRKTPNLIKDDINLLFSDSIMASRIVARCILLPGDHRLWVEEFTVLARSNFVNDIWFKVDVKRTRNVFPG